MLKTHLGSFHKETFAALNSEESAMKLERVIKDSATHRGGKPSAVSSLIPIKNFMVKRATFVNNCD